MTVIQSAALRALAWAVALTLVCTSARSQSTPMAPSPMAEASAPQPVMPASAPSPAPGLPDLDPDAHFKGKMGGTFGKNVTEILADYKRVAVAGFRVAFVTKDSASAQVRASSFLGRDGSGARVTVNATLEGIDAATLQALTDKAYANFLEQLRLAGREVVPQEELKEFLSGVQGTPSSVDKPFTKEVNAQTVQLFAPSGMPLWFIHMESGWSDRSGFDLGNWRRLGEFSKKYNAIVLTPLIVVNFVSMRSSGNQSGLVANSAEADAIPGMTVKTFFSLYNSPSDEGSVQMTKGVHSDLVFGTMKEVASEDNKAVKGIFDILGKAAGLANAGGASRATSNRVMQANNAGYRVAALDALSRATGTFARLFEKYPSR
jgi:hypothetical protein